MRSHTSTVVVSSVALAVQAAQFTWQQFRRIYPMHVHISHARPSHQVTSHNARWYDSTLSISARKNTYHIERIAVEHNLRPQKSSRGVGNAHRKRKPYLSARKRKRPTTSPPKVALRPPYIYVYMLNKEQNDGGAMLPRTTSDVPRPIGRGLGCESGDQKTSGVNRPASNVHTKPQLERAPQSTRAP